MKKVIKHVIPPCRKCPYKLGYVKTLVNPCPQCKQNWYSTFDYFFGIEQEENKSNQPERD